MSPTSASWPPLIVAIGQSKWVWARELLVTVVMWAVFITMILSEFNRFLARLLGHLAEGGNDTTGTLALFLKRLEPYAIAAALLVALLAANSLLTVWSRRRALLLAQPRLQDLSDDADRGHMAEQSLMEARSLRTAFVRIDDNGAFRVESWRG